MKKTENINLSLPTADGPKVLKTKVVGDNHEIQLKPNERRELAAEMLKPEISADKKLKAALTKITDMDELIDLLAGLWADEKKDVMSKKEFTDLLETPLLDLNYIIHEAGPSSNTADDNRFNLGGYFMTSPSSFQGQALEFFTAMLLHGHIDFNIADCEEDNARATFHYLKEEHQPKDKIALSNFYDTNKAFLEKRYPGIAQDLAKYQTENRQKMLDELETK